MYGRSKVRVAGAETANLMPWRMSLVVPTRTLKLLKRHGRAGASCERKGVARGLENFVL